jgi:sugar-specific transcriptional regulator TrmB
LERERAGERAKSLDEAIVDRLRKAFGLTLYEAKLYLALLRGARGPKEASSISGVPLPRIYDVVRVLESKGYVAPDPSAWYVPLNPRSVAVSAIAKLEEESRRRARMILDLADELELLYESRRGEGRVTLVRGPYSLVSIASEISVKSDVAYVLSSHVLSVRRETLKSVIKGVASRVPLLRVISLTEARVRELISELPGEYSIEFVELDWTPIDMVATREGVISVLEDPREAEVTGIAVVGGMFPRKVVDSMSRFWKMVSSAWRPENR